MIKSKLAIGPMSSEVIEAVFRFSNYNRKQLMLISSKNQIDYSKGYVNNWTTKEYMEFIKSMREKYAYSDVLVCRDHCGPGFNGNSNLEDVYKTIKEDIESGFDLIHIDFCHFNGTREEKLEESKKAIEYCKSLNPNILIEVGTDENTGANFSITNNLESLEYEINFFKKFISPQFYVVQTGSLVKEIEQVGNFNSDFVKRASDLLKKNGMNLKEHNADYLSREEIEKRKGIVDAMNIAPQLGVVQTQLTLLKCSIYGVDTNEFIEEVYSGKKWVKWLQNNTESNKFLCATIAGHYHFNSESYKKIIEQLEKREDIKETIINSIMEVISNYDY
jgi:hypothetical protein